MNKKESNEKSKSGWGKMVFALYGGFVLFMLSIVLFVSLQKFDLVEKDYYESEISYQQKIDMMSRANRLSKDVAWKYDQTKAVVELQFPQELLSDKIEGTVLFFRPSNAGYDRIVTLSLDSSHSQKVDVSELIAGLWRMKIDWQVDSVTYYSEGSVVIRGRR